MTVIVVVLFDEPFGGANETTKLTYTHIHMNHVMMIIIIILLGHCKSMKPAWDQLGDEYAGSNVLIGDVDCTADDGGKALCEDYSVQGYPTLKYMVDGGDLQDYNGGRDFDSFKQFVESTLEIMCDITTLAQCSDKETAYIAKMKSKGADAIKTEKERLTKMKGSSMKTDLKRWLGQRLRILSALPGGSAAAAEPEL
jgi:protein disulfide-isomerase A6